MPTTPLHGLHKPDMTYAPNVPADIGLLADDTDKLLPIYSDVAPAHKAGLIWFAPSASVFQISDGASWKFLAAGPGITRFWKAASRSGTSDNFSANTRTALQSLTFTGLPGTYQVTSRMSISNSAGVAGAGQLWINAGGSDIVGPVRADVNSAQRDLFTTIEYFYTAAGGSITVHHDYTLLTNIGTVWNGDSTSLHVAWLGP